MKQQEIEKLRVEIRKQEDMAEVHRKGTSAAIMLRKTLMARLQELSAPERLKAARDELFKAAEALVRSYEYGSGVGIGVAAELVVRCQRRIARIESTTEIEAE